jgi:hypothetical protein
VKHKFIAAVASLVSMIAIPPAMAEVIFDSITGPYTTFNGDQAGIFLQDQSGTSTEGLAVKFSSATSVSITDIDAYIALNTLANGDPRSHNILVGISADSGGLPSGGFLFSSEVTLSTSSPVSLSSLDWSIAAGSYWLVAESEPGVNSIWYEGSDTVTAAALGHSWGSQSDKSEEARITAVAPVPGPTLGAGASSFALAALFLGWLVRRRGSQFA